MSGGRGRGGGGGVRAVRYLNVICQGRPNLPFSISLFFFFSSSSSLFFFFFFREPIWPSGKALGW